MADGKLPDGWRQTAHRIAREVAQRRFPWTQLAHDLCDDAPDHVWGRRNSYDPEKGPFEPWCYTVIDHLATDLLRERRRRLQVDGWTGTAPSYGKAKQPCLSEPEDPRWKNQQAQVERQLDGAQKLSPDDLKQLEKKFRRARRCRVIALAVVGWWNAVPPDVWNRWLSEANIDRPFPPPCSDDLCARLREIADALGSNYNAVRQHFFRAQPVLRDLKYGREQLEGL